ncbi:MAG TPA: hypothetical protein VHW66_23585 [Stellaceae bacterium]|jgi:hypothetical protein|nr:hypothetical protein [Stellaceae bacterium]
MPRLPSERQAGRLQDILDNIARIERFTAGFDNATFAADEKALFACFTPCSSSARRRAGSEATPKR